MAFIELLSSLTFGDHDDIAQNPGMTVKRQPETPALDGTPHAFTNLPEVLYIPHIVMIVTVAWTVCSCMILSPEKGLSPYLPGQIQTVLDALRQ